MRGRFEPVEQEALVN
ncbi:unnamed protein product [Cuscuta epithymum]|uniref:Uncharacterized protein n=1 Tax=Cuscuta epithymum TaxID=186058 RepID=A0AAV0E7W4_9ASTE|nr:unnamed protein product [Cuscuta epithymum]CAH9146880.1 unnamed protein product [Cuscuta epithymum]